MTAGRPRHLGGFAALLILGLGLSGCFESKEEAALSAYEDRDFERAATLAEELAAENNPRGYELQALLAAQGIGRPLDFTAAVALIGKAVALDPSLDAARRTILDRVAIAETQGEKAFEAEDYDRALHLAEPLAAYGSAVGRDLLDRLHAGHHVLLRGSALTWRTFWNRCSGSIRDEEETEGEARFDAECRDRPVVWEGTLTRLRGKEATIKMTPGRARAPVDLVLALPDKPADDPIEAFGRKVRFEGVIAARGTVVRPDRLTEAAIIGPAYETQADRNAAEVAEVEGVRTGCINLLTQLYRSTHAPEWVEAARRQAEENDWPAQPMAFSVRLTSPDTGFEKQDDGSWVGSVEGVAEIILARVKPGRFTSIAFTGNCRVERLDTRKPEEIGTAEISTEEVLIDFEG